MEKCLYTWSVQSELSSSVVHLKSNIKLFTRAIRKLNAIVFDVMIVRWTVEVNRSFVFFAMQSRNLHNELNFPLRFKANNHLCTSEIEKLLSVRKCSGLPQCKTEFKASVNGSLSLTRILTAISNICTKIIGIFVLSWHVGSKKL